MNKGKGASQGRLSGWRRTHFPPWGDEEDHTARSFPPLPGGSERRREVTGRNLLFCPSEESARSKQGYPPPSAMSVGNEILMVCRLGEASDEGRRSAPVLNPSKLDLLTTDGKRTLGKTGKCKQFSFSRPAGSLLICPTVHQWGLSPIRRSTTRQRRKERAEAEESDKKIGRIYMMTALERAYLKPSPSPNLIPVSQEPVDREMESPES